VARARNIKPGLFVNDDLAELHPLTRLLFIGLWTIADREGRLEDKPKKIAAQVLPYDDYDVDSALESLAEAGFIQRYAANNVQYIQVVNFAKHQNPHKNEAESSIPAPEQHSTSTVQAPEQHTTNPADSLLLIPDSFNPITESLSIDSLILGDESPGRKTEKPEPGERTENFERLWAKRPPRAGNDPKHEARKAFNARMNEGEDVAEIENGLDRYCRFIEATGKAGTEYVMQFATFLGPSKNYLQGWTPPRILPARSSLENRNESAIQEALRS